MCCILPPDSRCRSRTFGSWVLSALADIDREKEKKMTDWGKVNGGKNPYLSRTFSARLSTLPGMIFRPNFVAEIAGYGTR